MKHIIFRNKKIFYRTAGKGKAVMLLHGFAEDGNVWKYQLKKLKQKFFVIVPDLPGSGASEMLDGEIHIEDCAEVVKMIADAELLNANENQCTLIGHSMGGYITLAFAEKYPQCLNAFGLFHSTAYADDDAKKEQRKKGIEFILNNGVASFLKTTTPNLFSEKTKKNSPDLIENMIDSSKYFSAEVLVQYYKTMMKRPDRTHVLQTFKKPVLFIIGKNDNSVPLKASMEQCHLPAIAFIKLLPESGHMGLWEERKAANAFLMESMKQL